MNPIRALVQDACMAGCTSAVRGCRPLTRVVEDVRVELLDLRVQAEGAIGRKGPGRGHVGVLRRAVLVAAPELAIVVRRLHELRAGDAARAARDVAAVEVRHAHVRVDVAREREGQQQRGEAEAQVQQAHVDDGDAPLLLVPQREDVPV